MAPRASSILLLRRCQQRTGDWVSGKAVVWAVLGPYRAKSRCVKEAVGAIAVVRNPHWISVRAMGDI